MAIKINDKEFIEICKLSGTMAQAAVKLNLHFNTFKRHAIRLNCYKPNQGGKGVKTFNSSLKFKTSDILNGKHPAYATYKLKQRLLKENIKENKCEVCKISNWNGKDLNMELDHINGNSNDHSLNNLRMICPNCHAQTSTYRSKNIKKQS